MCGCLVSILPYHVLGVPFNHYHYCFISFFRVPAGFICVAGRGGGQIGTDELINLFMLQVYFALVSINIWTMKYDLSIRK